MKSILKAAALSGLTVAPLTAETDPQGLILSGPLENGTLQDPVFVNPLVGWDLFFNSGFLGGSTVIGNIEAGHIWYDHEVFDRPPGSPNAFFSHANTAPDSLNELDFHATMVGHVLAGSGYVVQNGSGAFTLAGLGMAPAATLVSGAVAVDFSDNDLGGFTTTTASIVGVYRDFFQGTGLGPDVARPDVINSSWGGTDAAATSPEALAIDALARQNPGVAMVVSAGNSGNAAVSSPASGYHNISVGSLGGTGFLTPSAFSSQGAADFFNPMDNGGTTYVGVRAGVDLAAPGELMALAAYLGDQGGISRIPEFSEFIQDPPPRDRYFAEVGGTSFAAPIVAGGIALLKDVAKTDPIFNHLGNPDAFDTRVIKSVLMAGSQKTVGWDNGQNQFNVTTQALDYRTGAGSLDLIGAADVYFFGTRGLAGDAGGLIAEAGWDSATINLGAVLEYRFAAPFTGETALTVALNWFSVREFDDDTSSGSDLAFSNLDLQVWLLDDFGGFDMLVGESVTTYHNTEFLRLGSLDAGHYGLKVSFSGMVFDTTGAVNEEHYGLAWRAVAIPEPGGAALLALGFAAGLCLRRRHSLTRDAA